MKLSWDGSQEFSVRAMLDCGANVPVITQSFVDLHKVPGILGSHAHGLTTADGSESATNAGRAYSHACTLRCGSHFSRESFEIASLQSAYAILLPWLWIMRDPTKYVLTGKDIDMKFDSPKCKNCTAKAVNEFTIECDESVAYVGNEYEQMGELGTVRVDEELHVQIEVQGEAVKDIPWQDREFQSVYDGQYSDELPPHRSFDHAIDVVDGKQPCQ